MVVVALDSGSLQSSAPNLITGVSSDLNKVWVKADAAYELNEFAGQYAVVTSGSVSAVVSVVGNTAAASGAYATFTLDSDLSAAVAASGTVTIRQWEQLNKPVAYTTVNQFASQWLARNAAGEFNWSGSFCGSQNAFYSLNELKNNGAGVFYVLPVNNSNNSASLAANLAPTATTVFLDTMATLVPQPDVIVCPKQDFGISVSAATWATVDSAWKTFVTSWATDDTVNPALTEILYVTDCGDVASSTSAITYRGTTTNYSGDGAARVAFTHGKYYVPSLVRGERKQVASSVAYAALMNKIANESEQSYGHAFCGKNLSQVGSALDAVEKISIANRITLAANGINALVKDMPGGMYFYTQFTQKKVTTTDGSDPYENVHVIVTRQKIKNFMVPILDSLRDEPNTSIKRSSVVVQATTFLDGLVKRTSD